MRRPALIHPALLFLALAAACASSDNPGRFSSAELVSHGRYQEALEVAAEEVAAHPGDKEVQARHRLVSAAWHLDRGRRAFAEDRDREAFEHFEAARALAPEAEQPAAWIYKVEDKLADQALTRALHAHRDDELETAVVEFEEVLRLRPDDQRARELLAIALLTINYRSGLGDDYYRSGVRDLNDYELNIARTKFEYALKYLGVEDRVERRGGQVDELLAARRIALAEGFEAAGRWGAAKNEFRFALILEPENPVAKAGYERAAVEAEAKQLLKESELMVLKRRYNQALEMIERGKAITKHQRELFEGAIDAVAEARVADRYEDATDLEVDYQYEQAVAAYDALINDVGYYRDVIARRDSLQSFIEKASELYAAAEVEEDPEERANLYREIEVFWPEYRDIQVRLLRLAP